MDFSVFFIHTESTDNAEGLVEHLSKHQPPKRQGSPTKRIMKLPLSLRSAIRSHEMRWQVKRNDLNKVIYKHKTQKCFTGPDKLELEAQAGKANPKLVFKLYPYGLEGDFGKNATLDVEIDMPKKCRRLPSTAKAKLRISAWDCQEGKTLCCRDNIEIPMNHRQFPIPAFISHEALKLSHSELIEIHVMAELIEGANACFYVTTGDEIYV